MGLDQYWLEVGEGEQHEKVHYHRKVPALEEFMASKWEEQEYYKGEAFNCAELRINEAILDELDEHVKNKTLNHDASGFFFGAHCDEDYADIAEASLKARKIIQDGRCVVYTSWW